MWATVNLGGFGLILNVSQDKPSTLQNSQMCQGQFACIIHKSNINLAFGCSGRRKGLDRVSPIDICVDVRWWEICLKHPYEVENMMVYAQKGLRMLGGKLYKIIFTATYYANQWTKWFIYILPNRLCALGHSMWNISNE